MKGQRATPDKILTEITDYVISYKDYSDEALNTARLALFDSMGCALLSLSFIECTKRLGPFFPNTEVKNGCRIPGTNFILDPLQGAFNIGSQIRWLDYNDTWLGKEWGHPSDNFGSILAVGDWLSQVGQTIPMRKVLEYAIKAYEIQGILALSNAFNKVGFDHVTLVKIASTAVVTQMLGGGHNEVIAALSNAFADVGPLRVYRHSPNTGPRKSWAAGDAAARAVFLASQSMKGEMGYPTVLTAPKWGLNDVLFKEAPISLSRPLENYVMEHVLFKIAYPAEFHAQTAVEAAIQLHSLFKNKLEEIEKIEIMTHDSALKIIDKTGPLHNPADRDHCLQYMVACGLIFGDLKAEFYEVEVSTNPLIDMLREKMVVRENHQFSKDYHTPLKRSIANSLQLFFKDGSRSEKVTIEYPLGHKRRREEGVPLIEKKFEANLRSVPQLVSNIPDILKLFYDQKKLENTTLNEFMSLFIPIT